MNDIIQFEKEGTKILETNKFFHDLCDIMKSSEFMRFYDKYFNDWSDIQCMIFYMKLYSTIKYEYYNRFNKIISDSLMTYMLQKIMSNADTRQFAINLFNDYKENTHTTTLPFRSMLTFDAS